MKERNVYGYPVNGLSADLMSGTMRGLSGAPVSAKKRENVELSLAIQGLKNFIPDENHTREDELYRVQMEYYAACQAKKTEAESRMLKLRKAYQREKPDPIESLLNLERYKTECQAMKEHDLIAAISDCTRAATWQDKAGYNPDYIRAVSGELRARGNTFEANLLPGALQNIHANEPWKNTEEGSILDSEIKLNDVPFGIARIEPGVISEGEPFDMTIAEAI